MHRIILPVLLAFAIITAVSVQEADAALTCGVGFEFILNNELYIGDTTGVLNKVDVNDAKSCVVGPFKIGGIGPNLSCTDVALDPTKMSVYGTPELYCVTFTDLFIVDQQTGSLTFVGNLLNGIVFVTDVNALEIDSAGVAYAAAFNGNLYRVNLGTGAVLILNNLGVPSSGDLAWDPLTGKMFWTSSHCGLKLGDSTALALPCGAGTDGLWLIDLFAAPPTASFIIDTGFPNVFAADFAGAAGNICFVNEDGTLFELKTDGSFVKSMLTDPLVLAFGGTANTLLVGGIEVILDSVALIISGIQSSVIWMSPLVLAGVGFAAFKLPSKN